MKGIRIGDVDGAAEAQLSAYCDSDWAGDRADRKSTGAHVLMLNGGCVAWRSFKEKCVALSSTEAEYIALAECCRALVRARRVLHELGVQLPTSKVYEDNQPCIAWAEVGGKRTKHVDVRYHYSREVLEGGEAELRYCKTSEMTADALTKPLGAIKFTRHVAGMAMTTIENC